jgi:hypothetical protein
VVGGSGLVGKSNAVPVGGGGVRLPSDGPRSASSSLRRPRRFYFLEIFPNALSHDNATRASFLVAALRRDPHLALGPICGRLFAWSNVLARHIGALHVLAVVRQELGEETAAALAAALAQADAAGSEVAVVELDDTRDPGSTLN